MQHGCASAGGIQNLRARGISQQLDLTAQVLAPTAATSILTSTKVSKGAEKIRYLSPACCVRNTASVIPGC